MQVSAVVESDSFAIVGGQQARAMKIGHNAHAFKILSDALYGDKFRAVVREVLCNAVDAHIVAGIIEPVSVTLSNTELTIQDFGPGIPDDRMIDIYATYFGSTKIQDETQTGGFGLGSKSPFAYTDHFTVTSRHKGVRRIYALSVGDDDTDGAPSVRLMASMPCGAEQGVTVTVPLVREDDKYAFAQHIDHVVEEGGMNVVKNGEKVDTRDYTELKRVGFGVVKRRGNEMRVLYGNVQYPLGTNSAIDDLVSKLNRLRPRNYSILIAAPPSSLTVMPSREGIGYSPRTIKTVNALLRRAIHEIESQRGKARRDMVAEVLKDVPREMVGYALRTQRWNDLVDNEDVVVGSYNVARALEADPIDYSGKNRFFSQAKRLYRESRRGLVEHLTEAGLASDQMRICATKIMRIVKPASAKCKVYIRRNSFASLDLLRRKQSANRWPIVNVKHLIFANKREEALGFGESGYYVVASKLTPAEMDTITENAFRHGYTISMVISAPKKKVAPAIKRVKVSEDLYSPMAFGPSQRRDRVGRFTMLPTATVNSPKAYFSTGMSRSIYGVIVKADHYDLEALSKKIAAIFPDTVVAVTDKELAKLQKAGVEPVEELLIQKLRERVARHDYADAAFLAMKLCGTEGYHDSPARFASHCARISPKLGFLVFDLPPVVIPQEVKDLWELGQEIFSKNRRPRAQLIENKIEMVRFESRCRIYGDLVNSAIQAAPYEHRGRLKRFIEGTEKDRDFAHLGQLPTLINSGSIRHRNAESRSSAAFYSLVEAYVKFQRTDYNTYKKGGFTNENDD